MIPKSFERKLTLLVVIWLAISLSTPVTHAMGYDSYGFFFRIFIIVCALTVFLFFGAYPLLLVVLPLLFAVISLFIYMFYPFIIGRFAELFSELIAVNPNVTFIMIVALVTLIFLVILTKFKGNLLLLFLFGVFVFIPLWYLYVDSAYAGAVSYALAWYLLLSYQSGAKIWSKLPLENMTVLRSGWLRYTYWVLALVLIFATLLPKNIPPIPWTSFQVWVDEVMPFIAELRGGEPSIVRGSGGEFGVSIAGFGQTGQLGGPLIMDPTILVEVTGSGGHYLRGSVGKDYTGSNWTSGGEKTAWEPNDADGVILKYLRSVKLSINHKRLKTSTVFTLPYTSEIRHFRELVQTAGHGVTTTSEIELNSAYNIYGMTFAYRGDFAALENGQPGADLDIWLTLPVDLPARIGDLASMITANEQGYYAKMKALEAYLRSMYPYSENPSVLPRNRDFVDFFLFDEKKGYCTSFASALAVMGRTIGVPTRYVQGFKMPEEAGSDGVYRIPGTRAHAWVEAYIPGLGWLTFEATPIFSTMDSLPPQGEEPEPPVTEPNPDPPTPTDPPFSTILPIALRLFSILFIITVTIAIVIFITVILRRRQRMKQNFSSINTQTPQMQAAIYYNLALVFLAGIDIGKLPGETPLEYSERINRLVSGWKLDFKKISEGINTSLYSIHGETPEWLIEQIQSFHEIIFKRYVVQTGKPMAFYEIYLQQKYLSAEFFSQFLK